MQYNILDNTAKRTITSCNFNQHIQSLHPDRIMKEHDLIYIREGCWSIAQDGINYELKPGDVILLQSGHHHYGMKPCKSVVRTCFIHFNALPGDRVSAKNPVMENSDAEESETENENVWAFPMVVHCQGRPMVEHYFKRVIYSYWSDAANASRKAGAYLDLLLCEICDRIYDEIPFEKRSDKRHEAGSAAGNRTDSTSLAADIKLQIKMNPDRFISNEEFAKKYFCSVRTISSKFKAETGTSLHAWQIAMKCRMADELMRSDPGLTLKEIAANYGFYDEYHFSKCYKKIYGRSPKGSATQKVCSQSSSSAFSPR